MQAATAGQQHRRIQLRGPGSASQGVGALASTGDHHRLSAVARTARAVHRGLHPRGALATLNAVAVPTDLSNPAEIHEGFAAVREALGPVDVLVNPASAAPWKGLEAIDDAEFRDALDVGPRAALHCSQEAVADMRAGDGGTVIFTGATSALRGREGAIGFSAAKFACRGMAESMARDLGPEGIHVAHVVIDGQILTPGAPERYPERGEETFLDPDAIAETYWHLVEQDRSSWSLEVDVRPHVESF
jgi:NAD(P)-dependent dehydrogenase (short-subunit alcohol dehydrogenase family)